MIIHGIAVREKATCRLVWFLECKPGKDSLDTLARARREIDARYCAEESDLDEEIIAELRRLGEKVFTKKKREKAR